MLYFSCEMCAHGISCGSSELELTIPQKKHMSYEAQTYLHVLHALTVVYFFLNNFFERFEYHESVRKSGLI